MLRSFLLIGTTGLWLTMMSLLIQREFFQLTPVQAPYEVLPLHNLYLREEYQAISMGKEQVGFAFNVLESLEAPEKDTYEQRHQTYLSFFLLGRENEMIVKGKARLNRQLYLQSFDVKITSKDSWTTLKGQIVKDHMDMVIEGNQSPPSRRTVPVHGPVLYSESLDLVWTPENLKLGKQGRLQIWNPIFGAVEDIDFRVDHKENIPYEGKPALVFVVFLSRGEIQTRYWITPEGVTLRKETLSGLVMEKQEAWKIFNEMRAKRSRLPDLPSIYSVSSDQDLKNPLALKFLKVKIKMGDTEKVLEIRRQDFRGLEAARLPLETEEEALASYLAPTEFVQSEDPEILKTAQEIVGPGKSALAASLKIMGWVHQNVSPLPTLSIPSAQEVLKVKKGDCNEYTVLYTALARAVRIPTKMVAGLVYRNGRFYYHAWPEVHLGKWVAVDPTFHQAPVDVTHLPLIEGDMREQVDLAAKLGKIKIFILEAR